MAAELLYQQLIDSGVVLSVTPEGRLAFDAPAGAIDDAFLAELRAHRAELLAALNDCRPLVVCPWCRRGDRLNDCIGGVQCERCHRLAWRLDGDSSIVRADYVELVECEFNGS